MKAAEAKETKNSKAGAHGQQRCPEAATVTNIVPVEDLTTAELPPFKRGNIWSWHIKAENLFVGEACMSKPAKLA
jgi:hypothetical protein